MGKGAPPGALASPSGATSSIANSTNKHHASPCEEREAKGGGGGQKTGVEEQKST